MNVKRLDYRTLLISRMALANITGVTALAFTHFQGWLTHVVEGDTTSISAAIVLLMAAGIVVALWRGAQIGGELDRIAATGRANPDEIERLQARVAPIRNLAEKLPLLGLIGTVLGFIIALSGVDQGSIADPSAIGTIVAGLVHGMGIALYTTLVGAVAYVWLSINVEMLDGGIARLRSAA